MGILYTIFKKHNIKKKLLKIYIKEIFVRYRVLTKIISNKDKKFILKF
jgi:hypothetical protein